MNEASSEFKIFNGDSKDNEMTFSKTWSRKKTLYIAGIIFGIAVIVLLIGIILISKSNGKTCENGGSTGSSTGGEMSSTVAPGSTANPKPTQPVSPTVLPEDGQCSASAEAKRVDLNGLLQSVRDTYYKLYPNSLPWDTNATTDTIRKDFRIYNHTPTAIRQRTHAAMELLDKVNKKNIDLDLLKPAELKSVLQTKHFLKFSFGTPFEGNYYSGDWMLGPNSFCWQPICSLYWEVRAGIGNMKPRNGDEITHVLNKLKEVHASITDYVGNMKLGVKAGMVRTMIECRGGLDAIKKSFSTFTGKDANATDVLKIGTFDIIVDEKKFLALLSKDDADTWQKDKGMTPMESIKKGMVDHIGTPLIQFLRYLEFDHILHCRPDHGGPGGLSGLPIDVIYNNGTAEANSKTTKSLPIMENGKYPTINGSESYTKILGYFTTKDSTPDEVHDLGWKQLKILYPQVIEVAKTVTKKANESLAIAEFKKILVDPQVSFFNKVPFPANESDSNAHDKCGSEEGAMKYCPKRWAALQDWFRFSRTVLSRLDPKMTKFFYFTGDYHTAPNCPVELKPNFNPSMAAQTYQSSGKKCTNPARYNMPFFLTNLGPVYSDVSVNAHEARPGHHTQIQGTLEHFGSSCGGPAAWIDGQGRYTAFTEGWALYAENPLVAKDTDTYVNDPMQKYGMLKWQVWRALRLIVDTGLHFKGFSRKKALELFADYAWDTSDIAEKEVLRYQSNPGQATAYMVGQLDILKLRNYAEAQLGTDFNIKDFHYQALSQGSSPLSYLDSHIRKYVECTKSPTKDGCKIILDPPTKSESTSQTIRATDLYVDEEKPSHPHYF